jgi:diaminohydroxyphosphoribosylaminopyrimidine deaminase/5-amino-6-(5-phosphoribosylamino)uracil reductase
LLKKLTQEKRAILLVEGGTDVLRQFQESGYWDEIRMLKNQRFLHNGVPAPGIPEGAMQTERIQIGADEICIFINTANARHP